MYDIGNYYNASTIEEAIALMEEHPQAKLIAGGSDVLIRIREGRLAGCELIGIRDIPELSGVKLDEQGNIWIGAATTFSHITADPVITEHIPVLGQAVHQVGGPQVRNIGTIGGNLCNGAVSADSAPTVFSLGARLRLLSAAGERILPVEDFYAGPGRVHLRPGELLTHIVIPKENYKGYFGHYIKYSMRNAMDIATLGCCVVIKPGRNDGGCDLGEAVLEDIRITFGVAAPVPCRCVETEKKLIGKKINTELLELMESQVRQEINPRDSWRASRAFRLQIGGEIARRALIKALENGGVSYE